MSDLMHTAAARGKIRSSLKSAIWILIIFVTALSWPDRTAGAGSADPTEKIRVLHSSNGIGEISPCG